MRASAIEKSAVVLRSFKRPAGNDFLIGISALSCSCDKSEVTLTMTCGKLTKLEFRLTRKLKIGRDGKFIHARNIFLPFIPPSYAENILEKMESTVDKTSLNRRSAAAYNEISVLCLYKPLLLTCADGKAFFCIFGVTDINCIA